MKPLWWLVWLVCFLSDCITFHFLVISYNLNTVTTLCWNIYTFVVTRVERYGELAPECASTYYKYGCALLYKSQEETDPLGNVPKSAPDEESVKSTTNKDNGNSKASSSNVKDAPSSDKGGLEEGVLLSLSSIDSYRAIHWKTDINLYICV